MKSEQQVEAAVKSYEDVDSWKTVIFLYNAALKEVGTKLEILNDEFQHVHQYNPIEPVSYTHLGGDGSLNEVINGIKNPSKVTLGYIPTGSSNDFARGMGLSLIHI